MDIQVVEINTMLGVVKEEIKILRERKNSTRILVKQARRTAEKTR